MGSSEFVDGFALSGKFHVVVHVFASLCSQTAFSYLPNWSLPSLSHDPLVILIRFTLSLAITYKQTLDSHHLLASSTSLFFNLAVEDQ